MMIEFGRTKDLSINHPKAELLGKYSWVPLSYYKAFDCRRIQKKLESLLKEKFNSVEIFYYKDMNQSFSFRYKEDEAFFLVWSSQGIEI